MYLSLICDPSFVLLFRVASPFTIGVSTISPSSISLSDLPPEGVSTGPGVDSLVGAEEKKYFRRGDISSFDKY